MELQANRAVSGNPEGPGCTLGLSSPAIKPRLRRGRWAAAVLLLLGAVAQGSGADAALTTADIVRFLKAGISERTILTELQGRGFIEALDPLREAALRDAGASETLVVAVRRVAPPEPPPSAPVSNRPASPSTFPRAIPTVREPTFAVRTKTVRVPVSVLDRDGQPVLGLKGENFKVSEDGKPQTVTLFSGDRRPLRIALALDTSGSMQSKIRQVEEALRHFTDILEPADEIMVMTFSDSVRVLQDFTSDRALLGTVLDRIEPAGSTTLYDAVYLAIQRVGKGPAESKAVVIVSDGVDTSSRKSFEELREFARRSEVPVFSIGLDGGGPRNLSRPPGGRSPGRPPFGPGGGGHGGPGGGRGGPTGGGFPGGGSWPGGGTGGGFPGGGGSGGGYGGYHGGHRQGFDADALIDLADDTGGRAEILKGLDHYSPDSDAAPGTERLKDAVESIAMTLRHRYLLGYEPPDGKPAWRTIRVEVDRPPAATARARKGYYGS